MLFFASITQYDVAKIHVAEQAHFFMLMTRQLQTLLTALSLHTSQLMPTAFSNNQADRTQTAEDPLNKARPDHESITAQHHDCMEQGTSPTVGQRVLLSNTYLLDVHSCYAFFLRTSKATEQMPGSPS